MKLSKRGEYGLKAMIYLASVHAEVDRIPIKEIATVQRIPTKYLEQILLNLKNAGFLQSKAGVGGGYYLAKSPSEITLGSIVRLLDGPLAPIRCVSQTAYEPCPTCLNEATCGLRLVMKDVRNAIANILDKTTLQDVVERSREARAS